ncbi:hypothetical protein [Agrobacterium rubi]|uniref:Uncharacterized protein n=1 Tax=Agrobacterium rubi TaxID=28099 RepID=A0AAE7UMZ1_9HYPH|nr:hypothetical protein [Agrobacterium rubi]NTE85101.1 hypothetical protein [Agrobacterium rubi]NTF01033.1 hypothetical protein [Agrobacterium rubi]NTF35221.1 hypothetical protein [Agrobacterium rubi]OCJ48754.1 hypothetical protein A6U92_11595 [Agrobacterium rubi]QTG00428.1 hypothetical protein G6M88_08455 [Agrobacterium rubi]
MQAFDTSIVSVARSFLAIIWSLPAITAYFIFQRLEFLTEMPDADQGSVGFYAKVGAIEAVAVTPLLIFLCVPLLRINISASALIVITNWFLVPSNYLSVAIIYLAYLLDQADNLSSTVSLIVLALGFLFLATWLWTVLRTASGAQAWQILCLLVLTLAPKYVINTALASFLGVSAAYE